MSFFKLFKKKETPSQSSARWVSFVLESGETIEIKTRSDTRSSRLRLSWAAQHQAFSLTHPPFISSQELHSFLFHHQGWIQKTLKKIPDVRMVGMGDTFLFLGKPFTLRYDALRKKGVWKQGQALTVGQGTEDVHGSIEAILRQEAEDFFREWSAEYAEKIGARFTRISIRDGNSRWGSCSSSGTLSYSWRLGLGPVEIAQYVCAHEVAHLREMNHSPRFWALVAQLDPLYKKHRAWLKKEGGHLKSISFGGGEPL